VNADSGASSGFASVICAVVVGVAISLLTHLLQYLPKVVLASIIMVSVINLIEFGEAIIFFRTAWPDFVVFAVVFVLVLTIGVEDGLIIGILVQWILSLTSTHWAATPVSVLGYVKDDRLGNKGEGAPGNKRKMLAGEPSAPPPSGSDSKAAESERGAGFGADNPLQESSSSSGEGLLHATSIVHSASRRLSKRNIAGTSRGNSADSGADPESGPVDPFHDAAVLEPLYPGRHLVDLADARFAHLMRAGVQLGGHEGASRGTVAVLSIQAPIVFANAEKLRQTLDETISMFQPRVLVLACGGVTAVDSSGTSALRTAVADARARKVIVFLTGMGPALVEILTAGMSALDEGHGAPPAPLDEELEKQLTALATKGSHDTDTGTGYL